jgi:hypothetical protein
MTVKAIPDIIRALKSMRVEHAMMQRKIETLTATLVSVAEGKTKPEDLFAFRRQAQIEFQYIEEK